MDTLDLILVEPQVHDGAVESRLYLKFKTCKNTLYNRKTEEGQQVDTGLSLLHIYSKTFTRQQVKPN
jgi:hypothetical protein